ncbi:hypothetical protein OEA41_004907 [Lepraria neglecta]|uniref:Uncharacterized protein n=1 Tax=Lepraria neglecta TaxID=209136 RepID=A0AAE0DGA1_9LECA|nr:hypothetical protein OEA41_004907 [Lepraria neglecta]
MLHSLLLSLGLHLLLLASQTKAINIDNSCKTWSVGDKTQSITDALTATIKIYQRSSGFLDNFIQAPDLLSSLDRLRIQNLPTAFFLDPSHPEYVDTNDGLKGVFETLSGITLDNYKPKIFCGITLTTAADTTPDQKAGKFDLIQLTNPDGTPQINPSTGKQAFRYVEWTVPAEPSQWNDNEVPCDDENGVFTQAFTTNRASGTHTITFCPKHWTQQAGVTINDAFPYDNTGMTDDYSTKAPPANELDYYRTSTAGVLAHESHHVYIQPSQDYPLHPPLGPLTLAYYYAGATELKVQRIAAKGNYQDLYGNVDNCVSFALGFFFKGNQWTSGRAQKNPTPP